MPYLSESSESESGCESAQQNATSPASTSASVDNVKGIFLYYYYYYLIYFIFVSVIRVYTRDIGIKFEIT